MSSLTSVFLKLMLSLLRQCQFFREIDVVCFFFFIKEGFWCPNPFLYRFNSHDSHNVAPLISSSSQLSCSLIVTQLVVARRAHRATTVFSCRRYTSHSPSPHECHSHCRFSSQPQKVSFISVFGCFCVCVFVCLCVCVWS